MDITFLAPPVVRLWGFILFILPMLFSQCVQAGGHDTKAQFTSADGNKPFMQRLDHLSDEEIDFFMLGRSFFSIPWVVAPSATTARDGLGPLFNANTCSSCHVDNGTGVTLSETEQPLRALVFKLAQPSVQNNLPEHIINQGDPIYGRQVAINGMGSVPPEAVPQLEKIQTIFTFPDGQTQTLTRFIPYLTDLNYGELALETEIAVRQAPPLVGLGLIAQVEEKTILTWADPNDENGDGISGRANRVFDMQTQQMALGKYGWKAGQPTVIQQTADAAAHDMGLTNHFFPEELCTSAQTACQNAPRGRPSPTGNLDLPPTRLQAITYYVLSHKAPRTDVLDDNAKHGQALFASIGCGNCHRSELTTRSGESFSPYSDFLLHDMGAELADNRPEFLATSNEWRTAPLWGLGQRVRTGGRFLHDARAATPLEAILWHSGEAENAKHRFSALTQADREALISFLESL